MVSPRHAGVNGLYCVARAGMTDVVAGRDLARENLVDVVLIAKIDETLESCCDWGVRKFLGGRGRCCWAWRIHP